MVDSEASAAGVYEVKNLSPSGICLRTRDPIEPGRAVYIQLLVPDGAIVLFGRTVWVHPKGHAWFEIGCWHAPSGPDSRLRLKQLLAGLAHPLAPS